MVDQLMPEIRCVHTDRIFICDRQLQQIFGKKGHLFFYKNCVTKFLHADWLVAIFYKSTDVRNTCAFSIENKANSTYTGTFSM